MISASWYNLSDAWASAGEITGAAFVNDFHQQREGLRIIGPPSRYCQYRSRMCSNPVSHPISILCRLKERRSEGLHSTSILRNLQERRLEGLHSISILCNLEERRWEGLQFQRSRRADGNRSRIRGRFQTTAREIEAASIIAECVHLQIRSLARCRTRVKGKRGTGSVSTSSEHRLWSNVRHCGG